MGCEWEQKVAHFSDVKAQVARAGVCHFDDTWVANRSNTSRADADGDVVLDQVANEAVCRLRWAREPETMSQVQYTL